MKLKNVLIPLVALGALVGCGPDEPKYDKPGEINPAYIITDEMYDPEEDDVMTGGYSVISTFTDTTMGRYLATGHKYLFNYHTDNSSDPDYTVSISNENVAEVEYVLDDYDNFYIQTKAAGDFIITIYDADEMLSWRSKIMVRNPYGPEEIFQALYRVDKFVTCPGFEFAYGDWSLTFTSYKPDLIGTLSGGDDYERDVTFTFIADYDREDDEFEPYDEFRDAYIMWVEVTEKNTATELYCIYVSVTLDRIFVYYWAGVEYGGSMLVLLAPSTAD